VLQTDVVTDPRPRRGTPAATRERLVAAAARVFNRDGYHGTDSNRIAREAGYAPGSFYKHFADKRAIFLAAYEAWVTAEWDGIDVAVRRGGSINTVVTRIVDLVLAFHRRWRGFRRSLRVLVATDPAVRRAHRRQRNRQLRLLEELRRRRARPGEREADAMLLLTLERVGDAIAEGELRDLRLDRTRVLTQLRALVREQLG